MKQTILHDTHVLLGAKMVDFAGFMMPLVYTSITEEHLAVREQAGLFDVSHMGEIRLVGPDANDLVDLLFTNNTRAMTAGQVLYGMFCTPTGGVVDDLLVYKFNDQNFLLVVNAANIEKDLAWINQHNTFDADVIDESDHTSECALQGPLAQTILQKATPYDLDNLKFFTFEEMDIYGHACLVSRTGYTGEDGFEIYGTHEAIKAIFQTLLEENAPLKPCGLGCRDTLRFEVALPLYGHELSETITPIEAGLGFAVSFAKSAFIGREALLKQKEAKPHRRVVGLELLEKGILREGYDVYADTARVGHVTTGYLSPSTGLSVAMALIDKPHDKKDTLLEVAIRKKRVKVKVRNKKFYEKHYNK
ncbi:MAG: glycine cleavage system aminomethyltransferase GcvT [Acholeplasmatales bacterium]|nr:MAG: glycine cleavage system aminomethyltransferase GcvT [Acholeplasmatales bacterium]